ncbi:hypothetical protein LINPERHAP2_LOCUS3101 [Linum perenne]
MEFQAPWTDMLPLVEFAYNNSYHSSLKSAPFEALYGRKCRTPLCWDEKVRECCQVLKLCKRRLIVLRSSRIS